MFKSNVKSNQGKSSLLSESASHTWVQPGRDLRIVSSQEHALLLRYHNLFFRRQVLEGNEPPVEFLACEICNETSVACTSSGPFNHPLTNIAHLLLRRRRRPPALTSSVFQIITRSSQLRLPREMSTCRLGRGISIGNDLPTSLLYPALFPVCQGLTALLSQCALKPVWFQPVVSGASDAVHLAPAALRVFCLP